MHKYRDVQPHQKLYNREIHFKEITLYGKG